MGIFTFAWAASGERKPTPQGAQPAAGKAALTPLIVGSLYCANCHENPEKYQNQQLICRMTEFPVWKDKDRHQIAYEVLIQPGGRGQEIAKRMGIDLATQDNACVRCHGISIPQGVVPFQFDAKSDGVTCVACHGAFQEWILEHQSNNPKWRALTCAQKEESKGMRDLWDPKTRAEACASCHVGSPSEGRILTHEMYVAGHPPLPSFELATFCESQPRHWQYQREKPPAIQKAQGFNPAVFERTELVVMGSIVVLKESMRLLAAQAGAGGPGAQKKSAWPELARFDCLACHHELRSDQPTVVRSLASPCPPTPAWVLALVPLGLEAAYPGSARRDRAREFSMKVEAVDKALRSWPPYGDPSLVAKAARDLGAWADSVIENLQKAVVDRRTALSLLKLLCEIPQDKKMDYGSARQIFCAFRVVYLESNGDARNSADADIQKILDTLDEEMLGRLGRGPAGPRVPIEGTLKHRLQAIAVYDSNRFRSHFAELAKRLPPN
jgi:hypothetical protein